MAITLVTVCTPLKLLITGTVKYQRVISIKKHSKQLLVTRDIVEEKINTSSFMLCFKTTKVLRQFRNSMQIMSRYTTTVISVKSCFSKISITHH